MAKRWRWLLGLIFFWSFHASVWAGGSGLNVVVIVNQISTNSVQLGNYYCEQRQIPPQNLLRVSWAGGNVQWTKAEFESVILNPLLAMLAARQLTNQIDYVVLSMDFPYLVADASGINGTTSALFYGFKTDGGDSCSLPTASINAYAGSEGIFRSTPPTSANSNSFLVTMITSSNLAQAKLVIDHGVTSDNTFPTQTVYLAKSSDVFRNIRYLTFDNAIFNSRLLGNYSMQRTNLYSPDLPGPSLGYENGVQKVPVPIPTNLFVPGAMADELTSYGGRIYDVTDHTTALEFLNAGASGSYGTVVEPCAYLEKFPSPQNYYYQSRGFSLLECYYQGITNPFQGLVIGEPLAAPFAQPASGGWNGLPTNALLSGTTNLTLQATASDSQHPVQQVDLFLDGNFVSTITNIPPSPNNSLSVTINGVPASYIVPAGSTIKAVASNLTFQINQPATTNATKVQAFPHGDRVELQSLDITRAGSQVTVSASNSSGGAPLTTFASASRASFLDTVAFGIRPFSVDNTPQNGDFLRLTITKTNGTAVVLAVTNTPGGATTSNLTQQLVVNVNNAASLQGPDGVIAEDFLGYDPAQHAEFNLRARSAGWNAAQAQVTFVGSATFALAPSGTPRLDDNVADLRPRNHLYVTAGVGSLPLTFAFDSAAQPDGYHELTVVVYEGSHVRTQKRFSQNVRIQNSPLSAVFTTVIGAETALDSTLQFSVTANTNNISKIELFSTGGSLGSVTSQSTANFSVAGTNLGLGLHPFYALVTASTGKQYRTETKWIRLSSTALAPFALSIAAPPPTLTWPAVAGRRYDILSSTNITIPFQVRASITASSSVAQWTETNPTAPRRFYRVQTAN